MPSEKLASAENALKGNLASAWNILEGSSGDYTDLGIARRFGGAAAAYSLRDIGAMNGRVVKVRRDSGETTDPEEDFSANQVSSGALEDWVNGKLESTLPADVATAAAAYSLRKVKASYSGNAVRIRRSSDDIEVDVAFDSDGKVSASSAITNVAEQGGESGSTTATTLGDFISGTDTFVHTWYDQAGSNDAVQETAANQPKIAENGALLADGLLFDGSNDSFEATDITDVNFPATVVSVSETNKIGSPNTALYSLNNDSNACCGFYRSTSKYAINNGTTTLEGSATYTTGVHRLKFDLFNGASSAGFSNAVSDISGDIGTQVSQVTHFRIAGSLKAGITNPHNGTIKEIILYTSDQSDNRFKIESNINNYYGLYNDEYEWDDATNTEWQNNVTTGTTTFTANGKDGFTITATGENISSFKYAITSPSTASNDYYKVSFNVNDPDGLFDDAQLRLTATGAGATSQTITNGFNSLSLRTGASFEYMTINSDGGGSSKTATLSDFKISRIARNGFVQTWYDQSGNNRPMIQDNASEQPSIVENGGFLGGVKAKKATSDDTMQNLQVSTNGVSANFGTNDWASGANSKLGLMYVGKIDDVAVSTTPSVIWGGGRGVSSFQSGGLSLQVVKGGDDNYSLTNERQGLSPTIMSTTITLNTDDDMILYGTADNREFTLKLNSTTATDTETADLDTREDQAISLFGAYSGFNTRRYQNSSGGVCKECYLFAGDNISEVDAIATEINQHYNIY